jgi:nitrite reductase/ring-hydroxylating ferredoxin subunit
VNGGRVGRIFRGGPGRLPGAHPVNVAERLERTDRLDGLTRSLTVLVKRVLRPGPIKNALHGVPTGHPAHPPLTDLPVGAWVSAAVLDLLPGTEKASQVLIAAGLAGAVPTALTGLADWSVLHQEQQRVGLVHALGTATASTLYAASLIARSQGRTSAGKALGFAGLGALLAGGYLGGHLAFRQAAGANHAESVTHLVPLGWHDLCAAADLPDGWPVHRRLGYISLFVLRTGNEIHVLTDRCAHLGGPLHQGRVVQMDDELCVVCPWHDSTFRVDDGSVVYGPATAPQPAFATRIREDGIVQVRPLG